MIAGARSSAPEVSKRGTMSMSLRRRVIGGCVGGGLRVGCRAPPPPDEGELARIRFVCRPRREGPGIIRQLFLIAPDRGRQLVADSRQLRGLAEVPRELAHPLAIPRQ